MENLVELRIRVSSRAFEELRSELRGVISNFDNLVLNVLPSKDVEIVFSIPSDSNNMEILRDALALYRVGLRYVDTAEKIGAKNLVPSYSFTTSRGYFN